MYVDRHAVALLVQWAATPPSEARARRWLASLIDRATEPARAEFAAAVKTGNYPQNALEPRGPPMKPDEVTLTLDRAPPVAILLLNESPDPDLIDPADEITGVLQEELVRAFALWDVDSLSEMAGIDGWQERSSPPEPETQEGDSPVDNDSEEGDNTTTDDSAGNEENAENKAPPPPADEEEGAFNWKPYAIGLGAVGVLGGLVWMVRRKST